MLLDHVRVLELGDSLAAAVCGRLFAELGSEVLQLQCSKEEQQPTSSETRLAREVTDTLKRPLEPHHLDGSISKADLIVVGGQPQDLETRGWLPEQIRKRAPTAVIVAITPFGLFGPHRDWIGNDLVTFHASGVAQLLLGPVEDVTAEPPVRAAGDQSEFISGIAASCAAIQALYHRETTGTGTVIDVSKQEALAILPAREHSMPGHGTLSLSREKRSDLLGASYILPASDGHIAVSPREEHQWNKWTDLIGSPNWVTDPRFATHADRLQQAQVLIPAMTDWTRTRLKAEIVDTAQQAHIPCFAVNELSDVLDDPQIVSRDFLGALSSTSDIRVPRRLFGLKTEDYRTSAPRKSTFSSKAKQRNSSAPQGLPLSGVRVLDLSWVIAGPTTTRYLAAFGADVVKVESPRHPEPGRRSELHGVLGRGKRDLSIDLKVPEGLKAVREIIAHSDIVVENFAPGTLERLGLGYNDLRAIRDDVILLSASGLGQTGPNANAVAYGTLVQCFVGFANQNGYPEHPPVPGFAWSDPLLGLLLPFAATTALWKRDRTGVGRHIDLAMSEALLWTMPGSLIEIQRDNKHPQRAGNTSDDFFPHDVYRTAGKDEWLAIAITNDTQWSAFCSIVDELRDISNISVTQRREQSNRINDTISEWTRHRNARVTAEELQAMGVPAAASMNATMLFEDEHLWTRGFFESILGESNEARIMVGLPWRWSDGTRQLGPAPRLGANNIEILSELAELSDDSIEQLIRTNALGS